MAQRRTDRRPIVLSLAAACVAAAMPLRLQAQSRDRQAIQAASEAERQRELGLLGLEATRPPVTGATANYDEASANPYPLPDPLMGKGGRRAATARQWREVRRPEIVRAADEDLYGRPPADLPKVTWRVAETRRESVFGVPALVRELDGRLDNAAAPSIEVHIKAELVTPLAAVAAHRRTPVVLCLTWLKLPPGLKLPPESGPDYRQQILQRGFSYVLYDPTTVQADNGAGLTSGVIGLANRGRPRSLSDWGALRAWGWGASRILDELQALPEVDAGKVAIFGHSRYGKASLVAMAYDPRFAAGFVSSSGAGGAAPYRRHFGEPLENVAAGNEFHWMAGNFLKFAADPLGPNDLPIDSNAVIALAAPRPIFIGAGRATPGSEPPSDGWVDPHGMFMAEASAGEVWALLGKRPLARTFPATNVLSDSGDMAYREHDQGHTPGPNWPAFLDFFARSVTAP